MPYICQMPLTYIFYDSLFRPCAFECLIIHKLLILPKLLAALDTNIRCLCRYGGNKFLIKTEKSVCMLLSCHVCISEWIRTLCLSECQVTLCSKEAQYLKFKWLQWDSNPHPPNSYTNTQPNIECAFTLKCARNMIITYSWMHRTDKYSQQSSIIWSVWRNGWVFVYEIRWVRVPLKSLEKSVFRILLKPIQNDG